jgi:hypothetical protein
LEMVLKITMPNKAELKFVYLSIFIIRIELLLITDHFNLKPLV